MKTAVPAIVCAAVLAISGCNTWPKKCADAWHPPKPINMYVAPDFPWESVQRVLIMPLANNSRYGNSGEELRRAMGLEMQNAGRFEAVLTPEDLQGKLSRDVITRGKFDELAVLELARRHNAQAVMFGVVTDYSPYTVPRAGLSLVVVNPYEGVVIASLEHVWDSRELSVAQEARDYHKHTLDWSESLFSVERALESPDAFRRYVAYKVAHTFSTLVEEKTASLEDDQNGGELSGNSPPSDPKPPQPIETETPSPKVVRSPYFPYIE